MPPLSYAAPPSPTLVSTIAAITTNRPWLTSQMHDLATSATLARPALIPGVIIGAFGGLFVVVIAFFSWKRRCWSLHTRQPRQEESIEVRYSMCDRGKGSYHGGEKCRVMVDATEHSFTHSAKAVESVSSVNSRNTLATDNGELTVMPAPADIVTMNTIYSTMESKQTISTVTVEQPPPRARVRTPRQSRDSAGGEPRLSTIAHWNRGLSYETSISSSFMYSTQSGEGCRPQASHSVSVAALDLNVGRCASANSRDLATPHQESGRSYEAPTSLMASIEGKPSMPLNRLSHLSAGSLHLNMQLADYSSPFPIGLAYCGDE